MNLSMLLFATLSVATLTLAKPTEIEAPSKPAVDDGATSSENLIHMGSFRSSANFTGWSIRLDPRSRIRGYVIDNFTGGRITGITSGIGDWDLTLKLERFPEETMFFRYRFFGTMSANSNHLLSEVMEPRVQVTTDTEPNIEVVDGVTSSSFLISSGAFQSAAPIRWRIRLGTRERVTGCVIDNLRGGGITGIISGIGDWHLTLYLEWIPEQTMFFRYRFYGTRASNFNQLLSEVMKPRIEVTNVE